MADDLLENDSIVRGPPFGEKIRLGGTNELGEHGLHPIGNNLGNNLILDVSKPNRSEISQVGCIKAFGNKIEVGGVHLGIHGGSSTGFSIEFNSREGG